MLLDSAGSIAATYDYDAFGNILRSTINTPITTQNSFGFHSEYKDPTTGLVYLRARWYEPREGRFLCKDEFEGTQEQPMTLNKYLGFSDNPVNLTDPSGNFSVMEITVTIGIAGILSIMPVNLWGGGQEGRYKELMQFFYDAAKQKNIDFKVLCTLGWSESKWQTNPPNPKDPNDVGIMQINSKIWGHLSLSPDENNIHSGAIVLKWAKEKRDEIRKRIINEKLPFRLTASSYIRNIDIELDDLTEGWYLSIRYYKGMEDSKRHYSKLYWKEIYNGWPGITGNKEIISLWANKDTFLKK